MPQIPHVDMSLVELLLFTMAVKYVVIMYVYIRRTEYTSSHLVLKLFITRGLIHLRLDNYATRDFCTMQVVPTASP